MGTYKNGIAGPFSGKIGAVVGSSWKGIDYMRSIPRRSDRLPTERQSAQRSKMALAIGFLGPISGLVNLGFANEAVKKTGFNVATSNFITNSITGVYPELVVDYSKVLISSGSLTGAWNTRISSAQSRSLSINWTDNSGSGTARSTDTAVVLIYNPLKSQYYYTISGVPRHAAHDTLTLPGNFSGDRVEVWITFISANNKSIATSIYAGNVEVV